MSAIIHLTYPFDPEKGVVTLSAIEPSNYTQAELTLNIDDVCFLDMKITPESFAWKLLQDPNKKYGVKYKTDYLELAFMQGNDRPSVNANTGEISIRFVSMSYLLKGKKSYPEQIWNGSLSGLLSNLSNEFVFTLIGSDKTLTNFSTNRNFSDFDVLQEASKNFQWRDNGIVVSGGVAKPQILFGNINEIADYYEASPTSRKEATPLLITNHMLVERNDLDVINTDLDIYPAGGGVSQLDCYGSMSGTDGANSAINLRPEDVTTVDGFPLVPVIKGGKTYYYIRNAIIPDQPVFEESLKVDNTNNSEDSNGNQLVNQFLTPQDIYQQGVDYLRSKNSKSVYSFKNVNARRAYLPGTHAKVNVQKVIEIDKNRFEIVNLNTTIILKSSVSFDLKTVLN